MTEHEGALIGRQVTCLCGWRSVQHKLEDDAIAEFRAHVAQANFAFVKEDKR